MKTTGAVLQLGICDEVLSMSRFSSGAIRIISLRTAEGKRGPGVGSLRFTRPNGPTLPRYLFSLDLGVKFGEAGLAILNRDVSIADPIWRAPRAVLL